MENRQDGFPHLPWRIPWCPVWVGGDWTCSCGKMIDNRHSSFWKLSFSFSDFVVGLISAACHFLRKDHHTVTSTSGRGSWQAPRDKHLLQHQTIPCSLPNSDCATDTHGHILPLFHQCHFHQRKVLAVSIYKYGSIKYSVRILQQMLFDQDHRVGSRRSGEPKWKSEGEDTSSCPWYVK